ncbi:MAG: hypothetical protein ACOX1P_33530 [Thermoguttaceae bacterium]|jgi:hypothetical protein
MIGRLAFAGVFALLVIWLIVVPRHRIGQAEHLPPCWRNVRVWAIGIAAVQMAVYLFWG